MTHIITAFVFLLVALALPLLVWQAATATPADRARRLAAQGLSQRAIAARLGCSRWQVRQALAS